MKVFLWIYAVVGTGYWFMNFMFESDVVAKYAVGPLWLLMMAAPAILALLIALPVASRLGLLDK